MVDFPVVVLLEEELVLVAVGAAAALVGGIWFVDDGFEGVVRR